MEFSSRNARQTGHVFPAGFPPKRARSSAVLNIEGLTDVGNRDYTIQPTDRIVRATTLFTAARTWRLPPAASLTAGQQLIITKQANGWTNANPLTILAAGAETIEELGTSIEVDGGDPDFMLFISDGKSRWDLFRSGTNALLDGSTHSDTSAGAPTRGDLIVGNSTQLWARYALGTSGKSLKSDGSDAVWAWDSFVQYVVDQDGEVASTTTTTPTDDTIPQLSTEGATFLSVAITPKATTHRLVVFAQAAIAGSAALTATLAIHQDSTEDALKAHAHRISSANLAESAMIVHEMAAGTTSATTFKLNIGPNSGTLTFNGVSGSTRRYGGIGYSYLIVMEFAA